MMETGEIRLYGLDGYQQAIEKVVGKLNKTDNVFDMKLVLTEAISNAYIHGNKKDKKKPIILRYKYSESEIIYEVEDCGKEKKNISIPKEISVDSCLDESGRGLYLIQCFSDRVEFTTNKIIITKHIT